MGFGSYSESEQDRQEIDTSEIDIQKDSRIEFEGAMAFDPGADTDGLLTQLSEIMDEKTQEE